MPRLTPELAADIVMIYKEDERFRKIWDHLGLLKGELQQQINSTLTKPDEREILVHVREKLDMEVISILPLAQKVLEQKRNAGRPQQESGEGD